MESYRKKIILSADDFGMSEKANTNILFLAKNKKIDRISVMIDEYFSKKEVVELLNSGVKIDIHLNLPLGIKINSHSYKESTLKRSFLFLLKYFLRRISPAKIEMEWERQILKFAAVFGRMPDGLNSHQHIHYFPAYFKIVLKLAKNHRIDFVRFGSKALLDSNNNVFRILSRLQKKNRRVFGAANLNSTDYLASLDWLSSSEKKISEFIRDLPEGRTELVCHPERDSEMPLLKKLF